MEGSHPALPAEPGTLKATLPDTPQIAQMTERESAHLGFQQLEQLPLTNGMAAVTLNPPERKEQDNKVEVQPKTDKSSPTTSVAEGSFTRSVNTVSYE